MTPAAVGTVALAVILLIAAWYLLGPFDGHITGFFRIGDVLPTHPGLAQQTPYIFEGEAGHDGQQFLSLALDPLLRDKATLESIDNPRYRARRILYPALGHVLSAGNARAVPWMLVVINIIAFAGLTYTVAGFFERLELPAAWAFFVLGVPGLWVVLGFSMSDILGLFLLTYAFLSHLRKHYVRAVTAIALACLAREILVLGVGALALSCWLNHQRGRSFSYLFALLPAVVWNLYVLVHVPAAGSTSGFTECFGVPLLGIVNKVRMLQVAPRDIKWMLEVSTFSLLAALFAVTILCGLLTHRSNPVFLLIIFYFLIFLFARTHLTKYYIDVWRVFLPVYVLAVIMLASPCLRWLKMPLLGLIALQGAAFAVAYGLGLI
jgi:hypothetical protein